jgi:hypothetical protein
MRAILTVVIVITGAWIAVMLFLKAMALLLRRQTEKAAHAALYAESILRITDNASYLGAHFPGPNLPPRTNGVLALTDTRLFFLPWFPRKAITLPRDSISSVKTRSSFGNRTFKIPALILCVKGVGEPDGEMAWLVHEPEGWKEDIKRLIGN